MFHTNINQLFLWLKILCLFPLCVGYTRYVVEDLCGQGTLKITLRSEGEDSAGILKATKHTSYKLAMSCDISLEAPVGQGVIASIRQIGMRVEPVETTCIDWIKIRNTKETPTLCSKVLDLDEATSYETENDLNTMSIKYYVSKDKMDNKTFSGFPGFELTFTAFRHDKSTIPPGKRDDFFTCDNGNIIWADLKCDGHNNCGDMSDESYEEPSRCEMPRGNVYLYVFGFLMVLIFILVIVAAIVARKKKMMRRIFRMRRTTSTIAITEATTRA